MPLVDSQNTFSQNVTFAEFEADPKTFVEKHKNNKGFFDHWTDEEQLKLYSFIKEQKEKTMVGKDW